MYKNLNAAVLGVSGRQSELIELAMTYGFKGLDVDAVDLVKRVQRSDFERATRFLTSSKMAVSGFDVGIDLDCEDVEFEKALVALPVTVEIAGKLGTRAGFLSLPAATNRKAFPEFFEMMTRRVERLAEIFEKHGVLLGLSFSTAAEDREGMQYQFIQDVAGFLAFFHACKSKAVALVIDTYDWTVGGGTFEQLGAISGNRIAALRIADAESIPSVADSVRAKRQMSGTSGTIDNVRFVSVLSKTGYDGPISSFPDASNFGGMTRDSIVAKTQDALDHVLAGAGLPTFTRRPDMVIESTAPSLEDIGLEA
ncbi:MAG: sugar phosphate isomerase/epimerase [Pirellula sp.]|nr:sugar phosphate isomerase/epimerase [Pirellula sp.]